MGHFWLGGYASRFVQSPIVWVPLINSHYYEVVVDGLFVNNQVIEMKHNLNTQKTIVDTGTNDIILSTEVKIKLYMFFFSCLFVIIVYLGQKEVNKQIN